MIDNKLTIDLLRLIMIEELGIDEGRVNIYNQKFTIPTVDGLFIYLEYKGAPRIISSRNSTQDVAGDFQEVQDLNTLEEITIGLYSKNLDALRFKERAVMALKSIYSQQLQEENNFLILPNASIVPVSVAEASALLYRFDIDVKVQAWYTHVKTADFYDQFAVAIDVNDGTPDLEADFSISDTDPTAYPKT